jgi:hypothetical protein
MSMDGTTWPDAGAMLDDLTDGMRGRIKTELVPGERLLWAARCHPRPDEGLGGFLVTELFNVVFLGAGGLCVGIHSGAFRPYLASSSGVLQGFGLVVGFLGILGHVCMVLAWFEHRAERARLASEFYAVTDRRAILWRLKSNIRGAAIYSLRRGEVAHVHRVEYADGSGQLRFALSGRIREDFWPSLRFESIFEVRRVEELARETLIEAAPIPEDA